MHIATGKRGGRTALVLAAALIVVTGVSSLLGLITDWPYAAETEDWRLQARGQDIGNLVAAAALLVAMVGSRRGMRFAPSLMMGACLYLAYAFTIYAMTTHFGPLFLAYVAGLGLSVYCLLFTLPSRDVAPCAQQKRRIMAASLIVPAAAFALLWLSTIVRANIGGVVPVELEQAGLVANPVYVLDLALILPAMILTGVFAWNGENPLACSMLVPWLVFASLMAFSIGAAAALLGATTLCVGMMLLAAIEGGLAASAMCIPSGQIQRS